MSIAQLSEIIEGFTELYKNWDRETSIDEMRTQWEAFLRSTPLNARTEDAVIGGVPCRWIVGTDCALGRVIVFFHGGGYQIGSTASHHNVMAALSAASHCRVLGIDYRRAPEHRFPAPVEDGVAVYRDLIRQGYTPQKISFCGDSAGGGLAVAVLAALRDDGIPLPIAAVLMSPWVDMEATGHSFYSQADHDPVTNRSVIALMARTYVGKGANLRDPLASPIHADLADLPPLLVQVGEREVLLDDSQALVDRVQAAGGDAKLTVWPGMIHTFQLFAGRLDEADAAIQDAADFLNTQHMASKDATL